MKFVLPLLVVSLSASAQSPGVTSEWDIRQTLEALSAQAKRLKPMLDELTPQAWIAKGAPEAYVSQWKATQNELEYLIGSTEALSRQPERLTLALDTCFRLQALESRLGSLVGGVRNYQNAALGDLLMGALKENSANRDKLRQYITDLAAQKEQEFKVMDREAQRCRGTLSRPPAPAAKNKPEPKTE